MASRCTDNKDEKTCVAVVSGCGDMGTCSGEAKARKCEDFQDSKSDCTKGGCTYTEQCCNWKPPVQAPADSCATHGAGTLAGVCKYHDGHGPPDATLIGTGFKHRLFRLRDIFKTSCAVVASFRTGKGSATALGADAKDLVGKNCKMPESWEDVAEHVGHTKDSIKEYCENWVPGAMDIL